MRFTINEIPRTKKNSLRVFRYFNKTTKKETFKIAPSKAYMDYAKKAARYIPKEYIDYPVNVEAHFYMQTRHKVDLVNLQEALLDILKDYNCIVDDNSRIVASMDGSRVHYSKENPRTEVIIERIKNGKGD